MTFDGDPANERRAPRPLGRGLEEISHLFLSHPAAAPPGDQTSDLATERIGVRPATRTVLPMLRPGAPLTKAQVTATLRESRGALTEEMLAIGTGITCSPYGEIDLLALDRAHQLTVIDVQTTLDDGMLARGMGHVDWVARNLPIVQRLYSGWAVDLSRQPRLMLVAPRFSLALRNGIRQIAGPAITCFRYCEVELSGEVGIFVERIDGEGEI